MSRAGRRGVAARSTLSWNAYQILLKPAVQGGGNPLWGPSSSWAGDVPQASGWTDCERESKVVPCPVLANDARPVAALERRQQTGAQVQGGRKRKRWQ